MYILFAIIGLSCGIITAGGIFGLITKLRLLTTFADVSDTKQHLMTYENAILWGATLGNIIYLFPISINLPYANVLFIIIILFCGIFVGCLGMALAEALNVTAVFSRRMQLNSHLGVILLVASIGKLLGSLFYFFVT